MVNIISKKLEDLEIFYLMKVKSFHSLKNKLIVSALYSTQIKLEFLLLSQLIYLKDQLEKHQIL